MHWYLKIIVPGSHKFQPCYLCYISYVFVYTPFIAFFALILNSIRITGVTYLIWAATYGIGITFSYTLSNSLLSHSLPSLSPSSFNPTTEHTVLPHFNKFDKYSHFSSTYIYSLYFINTNFFCIFLVKISLCSLTFILFSLSSVLTLSCRDSGILLNWYLLRQLPGDDFNKYL